MINGSTYYTYYQERPTGENEEDYEGNQQWSYKQWAWEFLRRNRKFQEWCHEVENSNWSSNYLNSQARKIYGLQHYKSYAEPYCGEGFYQAKFLTSDIKSWSRVTARQQKTQSLHPLLLLRSGEVIIKFSVQASLKSTKSINAQLSAAKELLLQRKDQWDKRKKESPPNPRRLRQNLLELLRLLDVRDYNIYQHENFQTLLMNEVEIFVKVFPNLKPTESRGLRGESNNLTKLIGEYESKIDAADRYTEDYHDLAATANTPSKVNNPRP